MANVFDVAAYILQKQGGMTHLKLQKLAYYCQAWSLVWDDAPLYGERIEAWANGPVIPALFFAHQGEFRVMREPKGDAANLTDAERATVDAVLASCGDKTSQWLSDLTHNEDPWRDAREGLPDGERGNVEITLAAMANYYGNL